MSALREILASFSYEIDHHELEKAEGGVSHMIESLRHFGRAAVEAFAAYEIKEFVEKTVEGALQLNHAAIIAGTTAEKLQSLQFAAEASEVPVEALSMGLMRLQRGMFATGAGAMGAGAAFKKLGLDQAELAKKDSTEAFVEVAAAIGAIQNPAEQTALAMKIFGRGGAQLLPLMKKGKEGIEYLRKEVERLGGGFTGEYIEASEKYHESTVRLHMAWRSLSVLLTDKAVPALTWITDKCTALVAGLIHMKETVDFGRVGLAAMSAVGVMGIGALLGALGPMIAGLLVTALEFGAIALAAEDLFAMFQGDESVTGSLIDHFFGEGAAKTFVQDVTAMVTTWENFKGGLAAIAGTAGADGLLYIIKLVRDLGTELAYLAKVAVTSPVRALFNLAGIDTSKFEGRIKATRDAGFAEHAEDYQTDKNVNHAQYRADFDRLRDEATTAKIVADREAQLNQSGSAEGPLRLGPGIPTIAAQNVGVPDYMTQARSYVDKSVTTIQLAVGSTDAQAKAVGAVMAKERTARASNRAAVNALEPAVE